MGFDITFHPVSRDELNHFVFQVLATPASAPERVTELSPTTPRPALTGLYETFPMWKQRLIHGRATTGETLGLAAAIIAGHLRPYWFARGCSVSFLAPLHPDVRGLFTPFTELHPACAGFPDDALISQNHCASGFLPPERFPDLRAILQTLEDTPGEDGHGKLFEVFGKQGLDSLDRALCLAEEGGLGLIEAAEVVIPASDKWNAPRENMRAHYLDRLSP